MNKDEIYVNLSLVCLKIFLLFDSAFELCQCDLPYLSQTYLQRTFVYRLRMLNFNVNWNFRLMFDNIFSRWKWWEKSLSNYTSDSFTVYDAYAQKATDTCFAFTTAYIDENFSHNFSVWDSLAWLNLGIISVLFHHRMISFATSFSFNVAHEFTRKLTRVQFWSTNATIYGFLYIHSFPPYN